MYYSYHVSPLLSSLTSRYTAIIMHTILSSKENEKCADEFKPNSSVLGLYVGYFRFLPCLAAAVELDIQIHCYYCAEHIIQQRKVSEMKNVQMNSSPNQMC